MSEFRSVARAAEIAPGDMKLFPLDGDDIVIANVGGAYYAFSNTCPHEGGPLCEGLLHGTTVTCPWHDAQFDVRSGKALSWITEDPVRIYELRREGDAIQVCK
jgi:nitrite reductase/ring-hydroxylating ferredoxin subunit